jgi:hypothetical protein
LARYVASTGKMKDYYKILIGNINGRDLLELLGIDGRI